jgi:hypothetical protein
MPEDDAKPKPLNLKKDAASPLEDARERLYSPRAVEAQVRRAISASSAAAVPHAWGLKIAPKAHPHIRLALVFFIAAVAFAIVAGIVAALILFTGSTSVSTDNITLQTQGPTAIAAGDTVPLSLAITNKNVVALENATLEIDFPPGTVSATDETQSYPRYTEDLGTIAPGATVLRSVKAVVFGSAGATLSIPISLSYQSSGSNATFVKKATYPISVTSAPLSVSVEAPSQTVSGQPLTLVATVRSNATTALSNVILATQLPFGFSLTSSSKPINGSSFLIGTLAPGAAETITLTGVMTGQAGDQRDFHFTVGTGSSAADTSPELSYMEQDAEVAITAPFLATTLAINGDSSASPVLTSGTENTVTLSWSNTLDVPITDATISVGVTGAVAPGSIQSTDGFYDSNAGTVTFSQSSDPSLANLAPGASGIGSLSFETPAAGQGGSSVTFTISIAGEQSGSSGVPEQVSASSVETANIASGVSLVAESLHSSGPITDSGPVPPTVGSPTTYTILWRLTDPGNDTTNNSVSATLPSYVTFTNQLSPASAAITYDNSSNTVTWKPGDLATGQTASAAFQVSLTPSSSQSGSAPALTSGVSYSGFDRYAQVQISSSAAALTTETTSDPSYNPSDADVQ